jgi:hypothetical protein
MTELYDAVRSLAHDSPYAVDRTDDGFVVHVDVADAKWLTLLQKQGLRTTVRHIVRVRPERRTFTITDDVRGLDWQAGVSGGRPVLGASASRTYGRTIALGRGKVWAWDEKLRYGKVLDYTLDTEESRALIRTAAKELGYRERMPPVVRFALAMAVLGGGGAVVTLVVLAVAALMGKFS